MDWHRQQRLRSIEIILHWQGRLNTGDLIAAFGISRIQASKDIKEYRTAYPDNLHYNLSRRAYLRSDAFSPHLIRGTVDEYLDHIARMSIDGASDAIERMAPHYSVLKREVVSVLFNSILNRRGVSIEYASMTHPEGAPRIIYPHSMINTGFRWHVRAYCDKRKGFRDFNLGRILETPTNTASAPGAAAIENDSQWNRIVDITLIPNAALSGSQQRLLEKEFDMVDGRLVIHSRASLVHYMLQRYQIDPERLDNPPATQLLAVKDSRSVAKFLFPRPENGRALQGAIPGEGTAE